MRKKRKESYAVYIYKVLNHRVTFPESEVYSKTRSTMNPFEDAFFKRIANESSRLRQSQ